MKATPRLSIVMATYNRCADLPAAIDSALNQTASPDDYEIIVVDNNSTDRTAEVLERVAQEHPGRVRCLVEKRQGVAYARQAGIDAARAPLLAFFDDDCRVFPNWVERILQRFDEHPDVECLGGRVLPDWASPPPTWLTSDHWAPLALQDFGNDPMFVSIENPRGLISANLACRKTVFDRIGGFSPRFQRVKDVIGSLEDDEWIRRFWKGGGRALYVPELVATAIVPDTRITRDYHRRWHSGHGRFYALLRAEEIERTERGTFFGVPAHLYRTAVLDAIAWLQSICGGRRDRAFLHEVRLRFFSGFVTQRLLERRYP